MKRMLAAFLPLFLLCGCAPKEYSTDFFAMDTFMTVQVLGGDGEQLAAACEREVNTLEAALSRTREGSEVWKLNHAGGESVQMPVAESVLLWSMRYTDMTGGLYDPTVATLTDLWGIGTENERVPAQGEIEQALERTGGKLTQADGQRFGLRDGAQLDLGGIAKGYAADQCAAILRDAGANGLLTLGGNIYAVGTNGGDDWRIGIADPDNSADYLAVVSVRDKSVVTSGDYERYFERDGKRYHHIFDPRTGYPAESGLRSVTVIDENSTRADALTTALFVMGLEDGLSFCAKNGIAAVFITADKQIVTTDQVAVSCTFKFLGEEQGYTYAQ